MFDTGDGALAEKDLWAKAGIFGKILVPVLVAGTVLIYNSQANNKATATQMTFIAIGILSGEPTEDGSDDPIRNWAVEVLQNPGLITPLSHYAALKLRYKPLTLKSSNLPELNFENYEECLGSGLIART